MIHLQSLKDRLKDIERELEALKIFRLTPQIKKLQRHLFGEQSFVKNEISRLLRTTEELAQEQQRKITVANKNRSEKMKRNWRYLKTIKENYPVDLSLRELRSAFKKHKQGLETDIPDVTWKNPSP